MKFLQVTNTAGVICFVNVAHISKIYFGADTSGNTYIYMQDGTSIIAIEKDVAYYTSSLDIEP